MIIRLAAHRPFSSMLPDGFSQKARVDRIVRKKRAIAGRSQAYTEQARDGGGFDSARRQELRTACIQTSQDVPRIRRTVNETLPSSNASIIGSPSSIPFVWTMIFIS